MKKTQVLFLLGLTAFATDDNGANILTPEQRETLLVSYSEEDIVSFETDVLNASDVDDASDSEANAPSEHNTEIQAIMAQVDGISAQVESVNGNMGVLQKAVQQTLKQVATNNATMKRLLDGDAQNAGTGTNNSGEDAPMNENGLLGSNDPLMSLDLPWNQRAQAVLNGGEFNASAKYSSTELATLKEQLGDYYRLRRQDDLISWIYAQERLEDYFIKESGKKDQEVLVNVFLGNFSQPFQDKYTPKGEFGFAPEILHLYDNKIDHVFSKLKQIERSWIAYLNKEGAKAIKMSFIHYLLREVAKKLNKEQNIRLLRGIYKKPIDGEAGHYLDGSNGLLKRVKIYVEEKKVKPFAMGEWRNNTIVDYFKRLVMKIPQDVRDEGLVVYCSKDAKLAYKENYRLLYGKEANYTGPKEEVELLDSLKIIALPYMAQSKRIIVTLPDNFRIFEGVKDEMLDFELEQEDRTLKVWSDWKEGIQAILVGKVKSDEEWESDKAYDSQLIFMNDVDEPADYFREAEKGATVISTKEHRSIVSHPKEAATITIDNIEDVEVGQIVRLKSYKDSASGGFKIAKSGVFSKISATWTPKAGGIIELIKVADGKFREIRRLDKSSYAKMLPIDETDLDLSGAFEFKIGDNTQETDVVSLKGLIPGKIYTIHGPSTAFASVLRAGSGKVFKSTESDVTLDTGSWVKITVSEVDEYAILIDKSA